MLKPGFGLDKKAVFDGICRLRLKNGQKRYNFRNESPCTIFFRVCEHNGSRGAALDCFLFYCMACLQ
jgi:hypothetical protein